MGFAAILGLACAGIPVYFLPRFRPDEVLDAIESRRASIFIGVPAMYRMLLEAGAEQRDLSSVRAWGSGADAMPSELAAKFKSLGVTKGYWGDTVATEAALTDDGWLRTGDLVRRGVLGAVVFEGRKKDVIKHGGYSVYALEVERVLEDHPDVVEAAVVGMPDERKGEIPVAAVRL